jgi:hypothetical protein
MISRFLFLFFVSLFLAACGSSQPLREPSPICNVGQISTEEEPCVARPPETETDPENPDPENPNPDTPTPETPDPTTPTPEETPTETCGPAPVSTTSAAVITSQTTFKACYAPGAADEVFVSLKLEDSAIAFIKPTIVFDIVRLNSDNSTTSMAVKLLDGQPSANPDFLKKDVTKEELLAGLEASVALKFKSSAPKGKYDMVISLFKDSDAYDGNNLVGRVFYNFEIK